MKRIMTIIISLLFLSCSTKEGVKISWTDYNIVGNVKMFSDKILFAKCNDDLVVSIDTNLSNHTIIQNRYFDKNGLLRNYCYYDKDSVMFLENVYVIVNDEIIGANTSNIRESKKEKVEINKINENLFESKTYNTKSNEIISTSYTHRKNGFTYKQISESKFSDRIHKNKMYFIRNQSGFVTEIIDTTIIDNQVFTNKTFVQYLEFDERKNWTKKIEYSRDSICRVTLRKLEYY